MSQIWSTGFAISFFLSLCGNAVARPATPASRAEGMVASSADEHNITVLNPVRSAEEVIRAALALLPEEPAFISLIDVDAQDDPRVRGALRPLEAFTLPGKIGVFVNLHGATIRRAVETPDERIYRFDLHVLAAIVWHEMAHVAGADEAEAQAREEKLWKRFIRDGCVEIELALRQMQIYASRRRQ